MLKNVLFDFGQVLVHFDVPTMVAPYVRNPEDARLVGEAVFDRALWDRLDRGTVTDGEVKAAAAARLPERLRRAAEQTYDNWIYHLPEMEGMRELLAELRGDGLRLFVLSDISRYFAAHARAGEIPILREMDGCVFSGECGRVKPTAEAFLEAAKELGIEPGETLFVDDKPANAQGAARCGFYAFCFTGDADALRRKIGEIRGAAR